MTEPYPEDIANAIKRLVNDETMCAELSKNAEQLIVTTFNWDSLIKEYITMYKKVIG